MFYCSFFSFPALLPKTVNCVSSRDSSTKRCCASKKAFSPLHPTETLPPSSASDSLHSGEVRSDSSTSTEPKSSSPRWRSSPVPTSLLSLLRANCSKTMRRAERSSTTDRFRSFPIQSFSTNLNELSLYSMCLYPPFSPDSPSIFLE